MVTKRRIDRNAAHFGFEDFVCHLFFVFYIRSAKLIVVVMTHNVSGKNRKFDIFHIEKGRH